MKVSELKKAAEDFMQIHGDATVKLLWEEGVLSEGFNSQNYELPTDIRAIKDWPLPGDSMMFSSTEDAPMHFVMMYGEIGMASEALKTNKRAWQQLLDD